MTRILPILFLLAAVAGGQTPIPPALPPRTASFAVEWDASPTANVTYVLRYGTQSGEYYESATVGTALQATVSNLLVGTPYYFVVYAVDSQGIESGPSNELAHTPQPRKPLPPPTHVVITVPVLRAATLAGPWTVATNVPVTLPIADDTEFFIIGGLTIKAQ